MSVPSPETVFLDTVGDLLDSPPQMLMDVRFAEQEARRIAEDQVLVELFSNARDAALRGGKRFMTVAAERAAGQGPTPPARVWVRIEAEALVVANDGAPFAASAYRAVRRIARSTKRGGPEGGAMGSGQGIALTLGRHGVGFRSVLALSDRPQIYGRGPAGIPFGIEFGAPRLRAFTAAAASGDQEGALAALLPDERPWLAEMLTPPLDLSARSLRRHAARWEIPGSEIAEGLPVLPFPLAVPPGEVPAVVRELLHLPERAPASPDGSSAPPDGSSASPDGSSAPPDGSSASPDGSSASPDDSSAPPDGSSAPPDGSSAPPDSGPPDSTPVTAPVDRPYATVIYLPFDPPLSEGQLAQVRGQREIAQRCFLGTRIRLQR